MNIVILNGNPDASARSFEEYLASFIARLKAAGHATDHQILRDLDLRQCSGCFGCWVKTPGECVSQDDSCQVSRAMINADFVLWSAPLVMGYPNALLKQMMDKSIPLIHPYFTVDRGEAHHRARYERYPRLGLLVQPEAVTTADDLNLLADLFGRTAVNMKSRLEFLHTTDQPVENLVQAVVKPGAPLTFDPAFTKPTTGVRINPPSRLTIFNGSPRGPQGNTPILLAQLAAGFAAAGGQVEPVHHLFRSRRIPEFVEAFRQAESVWLGFPLYTDAMPGVVKAFIDALAPLAGQPGNPPIGFLVQSGFPESLHSRHVEHYLQRLAQRLGSPYLGAIVKGGGEGVRMMPDKMNRKLFDALQAQGRLLRTVGRLDPAGLKRLARLERYPRVLVPVFKLLVKMPLLSFYWNSQLKQNGAYDRRFAQPYID